MCTPSTNKIESSAMQYVALFTVVRYIGFHVQSIHAIGTTSYVYRTTLTSGAQEKRSTNDDASIPIPPTSLQKASRVLRYPSKESNHFKPHSQNRKHSSILFPHGTYYVNLP